MRKDKVKEGKRAKFKISLPDPLSYLVSFDYMTEKGKAKPGKDFKTLKGVLSFAPGTTDLFIRVKTTDNQKPEKKEKFSLVLDDGGANTVKGGATIIDEDR